MASAQNDEAEAKRHYRVGLVALENNDLSVAADEFREASKLAPNIALVNYYLAIKMAETPGKAKGDFKYVGCNGQCGKNANAWDSFQTVLELRSAVTTIFS